MSKFSINQWIGIVLLIAAALIWAPLPAIIAGFRNLGALAVVIIGIWQLFR